MSPREKPAKADRTPLEGETQEQADRRADDQDAAIEAAFVAGTLPEEDRRAPDTPSAPAVPEVAAPKEHKEPTLADRLNALPDGSSATFVRGHDANHWVVQHGNGAAATSRTFDRALRLIGSQRVHDESSSAGFRLIDTAGEVIAPDDLL